jgi:lysozyme
MKASEKLISAIKGFEGLRLESYKCPAGVWTIGYGHTRGVKAGQKITIEQAESLLKGDLLPFEKFVDGIGLELTQGQFDALVDFSYNLGVGRLQSSTLLKKIRSKESYQVIRNEFLKWTHSGGKVLAGLVRRREWEADRWEEQD